MTRRGFWARMCQSCESPGRPTTCATAGTCRHTLRQAPAHLTPARRSRTARLRSSRCDTLSASLSGTSARARALRRRHHWSRLLALRAAALGTVGPDASAARAEQAGRPRHNLGLDGRGHVAAGSLWLGRFLRRRGVSAGGLAGWLRQARTPSMGSSSGMACLSRMALSSAAARQGPVSVRARRPRRATAHRTPCADRTRASRSPEAARFAPPS
jgi:hypothetical protein